ncbi:hypothetical protein FNV43_RR22911 [Rhamnella rubrinervis]|uniref:Small auxin up regulated protein n=1 Tax=Rhamnella rubrinervis TaxID=2594499 RepID=A0A8K0GRK1_9ROSA|nr:hypothetical protein FNV43_RR22911 [Rhamnella rubrinervis]
MEPICTKGLRHPKRIFCGFVGDGQKKRFVIPICLLKEPSFQYLLSQAEAEFDYDYPMGGITISCHEDIFFSLISRLNVSSSCLGHHSMKTIQVLLSPAAEERWIDDHPVKLLTFLVEKITR